MTPAYSVSLAKTCQHDACEAQARKRVYNSTNAAMGDFCFIHARELVDHLNAEAEARVAEADRETNR